MNKKQSAVIVAVLVMALTSVSALAAPPPCLPPVCAMAIAPPNGRAPFVVNVHYTLTGIPLTSAVLYYGDGASDPLPLDAVTGYRQHIYTAPGVYPTMLQVGNDCGVFALVLTVYVTP